MAFAWIEQKRRYRRNRARVAQLPPGYQAAVGAMIRYMNHLGGVSDGASIMTMLEDLTDLFERAAADGTPVRAIFGDDPVEFAQTFLSNYPAGRWITREQERLVAAIDEIALAETA